MHTPASIALYSTSNSLGQFLQQLSLSLQLPVIDHSDDEFDYLLILEPWPGAPGYISKLQKTGANPPGPVYIDFTTGKSAHRRQYGGGRKQALARAVGMKPGHNPVILDVTAGLGKDAFVLASLGCQIILVERIAAIFELLDNGITRARYDSDIGEIASRMELVCCDSAKYLQTQFADRAAEVIYLDPMYPGREKSALVKKEMRYFHDIAGKDDDAANLLLLALQCKPRRVVVKRPASALPLAGKKPDTVVSSKNTRYDIYLRD